MSVLETVTVDNVTYDMHDPLVGSGTLQTTAQTLIPAVNEVKSGLTTVSGKTDVIGSGALNTTSQTLIGAVNELNGKVTSFFEPVSGTITVTRHGTGNDRCYYGGGNFTLTRWGLVKVGMAGNTGATYGYFGCSTANELYYVYLSSTGGTYVNRAFFTTADVGDGNSYYWCDPWSQHYLSASAAFTYALVLLPPGTYCFGTKDSSIGGTSVVNYHAFQIL